MKRVDLGELSSELSFKIKMEAYLYKDANVIMERGKGDKKKLMRYMTKRIKIIEELLQISHPFVIVDGTDVLLRVEK